MQNDGEQVITIILAQSRVAVFVCEKL